MTLAPKLDITHNSSRGSPINIRPIKNVTSPILLEQQLLLLLVTMDVDTSPASHQSSTPGKIVSADTNSIPPGTVEHSSFHLRCLGYSIQRHKQY